MIAHQHSKHTATHCNRLSTGRLRHSVTIALIRMVNKARIRRQHMRLCVCACTYVYMYMYIYIYEYIYMCIYVYVNVYVVCVYVHPLSSALQDTLSQHIYT